MSELSTQELERLFKKEFTAVLPKIKKIATGGMIPQDQSLSTLFDGRNTVLISEPTEVTMANSPSVPNGEAVRRALESARNNEDGQLDPRVSAILECAIGELWRKIQQQPDTYILTRDEFALFNYFRDRFRDSPITQRLVERFWNNFQGLPSDIDGYICSGRR